MLKNYFKVALRNMMRRKGFTTLNLLGLAIGIVVCLLIVLFVNSELNYDAFHLKSDRIYRLALERIYPGRSTSYAIIPQSIGGAMQKEFPEIEESVRMLNFSGDQGMFVRIGDKVFNEKKILFADSNIFKVFTITLLAGNPDHALSEPNSIVLNETTAKKYFGAVADAMGKSLTIDDRATVITGVCRDMPLKSHFTFDMLGSATTFQQNLQEPNYINFSSYTYFLLAPAADPKMLAAKFPAFVEKYVAPDIEKKIGVSYKDFISEGNGYHYFLQPLKTIHLSSNLEAELSPNGSISIVYAFGVIAIFILLLACINFINLSTARSLDRAKEVGIRKTFGGERSALIRQFLFESVITASISLVVAMILIFLLLPFFNNTFNTQLSATYFFHLLPLTVVICVTVIIGILAGLYPAFILSSFQPISVLKGKFSFSPRGHFVQNGLVVLQFAISVTLIIATLIVSRQMKFMVGDQLGFRKDHIIEVKRTDLLNMQSESFKNDLLKINGVEDVTGTSALPGDLDYFGVLLQTVGSNKKLTGRGIIADDKYLSALDIPLVKGRYFSKDMATDSLSIVLNEKAASELGISDPVGTRLISPDGLFNLPDGTPQVLTIVGVVKDFHFQSLHQMITPLIFMNGSKFQNISPVTAIRIQSSQFSNTLNAIEKTWDAYVPQHPFQFTFLDQQLIDLYNSEQTTERLFMIFSILAVFIACMGLLGLITYATQKRSREIGIRKVLGAGVGNIIALLSADFLKLVCIAAVISFPLAWMMMNRWLQDFAYRVSLNWWVFLIAAVIAIIIAISTVIFHAIKAAIANPVKSLRME